MVSMGWSRLALKMYTVINYWLKVTVIVAFTLWGWIWEKFNILFWEKGVFSICLGQGCFSIRLYKYGHF